MILKDLVVCLSYFFSKALGELFGLVLEYARAGRYKIALGMIWTYWLEPAQIRKVVESTAASNNPYQWIDQYQQLRQMESHQKREEIAAILRRIHDMQAHFICEIGTKHGGTLALLMRAAHPEATIISIDLDNAALRQRRFSIAKQPQQRLHILKADSQTETTHKQVATILGSNRLDFLLIDGDHAYQGVVRDFDSYKTLVKPGGLIAFHDIQPSHAMTRGIQTLADVGDVPRFWEEIKSTYPHYHEVIENKEQDGFGIGILSWHDI
jgi:predicted O-methyltransferase YrrM